MTAQTGTAHLDPFDLLLNDVLHALANPELPERFRVQIHTRVWLQHPLTTPASQPAIPPAPSRIARPAVVFSPAKFQARMAPQRDARSTLAALLLHAAMLGLVFWLVAMKVQFAAPVKTSLLTELATPPPQAPTKATAMGGGGGQRGATPICKGALPKFADTQLVPPKAPPLQEPRIKIDPTIEVQKDLKMANSALPSLGMPSSPLVGASMGNGSGTGSGSGNGSGLGAGTGGNYGGGLRQVGGGVSAPVLLFKVDPEFSEEARKAKASGNVLVNLWVDEKGYPTHVRVLRGVGIGLDEKAVAAVQQYRFRPAMEAGKPVLVELNVEVNFQIF